MNKQQYDKKLHTFGRLSVITFLSLTFLIPLTLWLRFGLLPSKTGYIAGATSILAIMVPISIAEFLSYITIVGPEGFYIMCVTGNLANMKIPAAVTALDITKVDPSSEEGEIISGMAMSVSTITAEIVIFIGVMLLVPLTPVLQSPVIQPAFSQIVPALFGALITSSVVKNPKTSIIPILSALLLFMFVSSPFGAGLKVFGLSISLFTVPILIAISLTFTRIAFNLGFFDKKN